MNKDCVRLCCQWTMLSKRHFDGSFEYLMCYQFDEGNIKLNGYLFGCPLLVCFGVRLGLFRTKVFIICKIWSCCSSFCFFMFWKSIYRKPWHHGLSACFLLISWYIAWRMTKPRTSLAGIDQNIVYGLSSVLQVLNSQVITFLWRKHKESLLSLQVVE